jgi:5-oxoprolinase (ATP-hydrolysing) subunit B
VNVAIERFGEPALVLTVAGAASPDVQRRIWRVAREARAWKGVIEAVCGAGNLSLVADPDSADFQRLEERLRETWSATADAAFEPGRLHEIPVSYGGDDGPDLAAVADHAGLSRREVVELHAGGEYAALFLGFLPGFAYLGGLDPRLAMPRRRDPRTAMPAGSVAIGGTLTGIYPFRSPGGWHAIGRTQAVLFDPRRSPAASIAPGDRVRFVPVR